MPPPQKKGAMVLCEISLSSQSHMPILGQSPLSLLVIPKHVTSVFPSKVERSHKSLHFLIRSQCFGTHGIGCISGILCLPCASPGQ